MCFSLDCFLNEEQSRAAHWNGAQLLTLVALGTVAVWAAVEECDERRTQGCGGGAQ